MEKQICEALKDIYTDVDKYLGVRTPDNTSKTNKISSNPLVYFLFLDSFISYNLYSVPHMHNLILNNH